MIIFKEIPFVILHMPRCAGSSIRWGLINSGYTYKYSCEHLNYDAIPNDYSKMPTIGFIRNPAEWYLSLFYQHKRKPENSIIVFEITDRFTVSFDIFIKRATDLKKFFIKNPLYISRIKRRIQHIAMNRYVCWITSWIADLDSLNADFFTGSLLDHWFSMVGLDRKNCHVFRVEDGIENILSNVINDKSIRIGNRNSIKSRPGMQQMNNRILENIRGADSFYFKKFGYEI
jgi:hypothetical protein